MITNTAFRAFNVAKNRLYLPVKKSVDQKKALMITRSPHVFVFGVQKSGTTVIAALLAQATNNSVTLDFKRDVYKPGWNLLLSNGLVDFDSVVSKRLDYFSAKIIKEPELTFFADLVKARFDNSTFLMIQRHPYHVIKSCLTRLDIPGDLQAISFEDYPAISNFPGWKAILNCRWMGFQTKNHIEALAYRWNYAANLYLDNPDDYSLFRYEDFLEDKPDSISRLAEKCGLEVCRDISELVDVQYQHMSPVADVEAFLGSENCEVIKDICGKSAHSLGYSL